MSTKTRLMHGRTWLLCTLTLMIAGSMTGYAQNNCFEYEDNDETVITGLTETGLAASSLTIPKEVTAVRSSSFSSSSAQVSALVIESGGNPTFERNLFGTYNNSSNEDVPNDNPLRDIQILGNSMTVGNIRALLMSLGARGDLSTVYVEGYSGTWEDIVEPEDPEQLSPDDAILLGVLTSEVEVALSAALVTTQQFGYAKVYGRFTIDKELISFCGSATFQDTDDGSNQLFYVADGIANDGRLHIQRVRYVQAGKGVLIHRVNNSSGYADLLRYDGTIENTELTLYSNNMLVGVTTPTRIEPTAGDKTNYILKNAAFHPAQAGTIGANKAYLQVPTGAKSRELLGINFDEETTKITPTNFTNSTNDGAIYDFSGRKVNSPLRKGLYITNGKKYISK